MNAEELMKKFLNMETPDDIFMIHDEFQKISDDEKKIFRQISNRDQVSMAYITAVEMKKNGTWDKYVKDYMKNKSKSPMQRINEYIESRNIIVDIPISISKK